MQKKRSSLTLINGSLSTTNLAHINQTKARISRTCENISRLCRAANMPTHLWSYLMALLALAQNDVVVDDAATTKYFTASNEDIAQKMIQVSGRNYETACRTVRRQANDFFDWQAKAKIAYIRRIVGGQDPKTNANVATKYEIPVLDLLAKLELVPEQKPMQVTANQASKVEGQGTKVEGRGDTTSPLPTAEAVTYLDDIIKRHRQEQSDRPAIEYPFGRPQQQETSRKRKRPTVTRAEDVLKRLEVRRGQLWEIPSKTVVGESHWLMCGDSTDLNDVAQVMRGRKADLLYTDPPYNVDVKGGSRDRHRPDAKQGGRIANDKLSAATFEEFLSKSFEVAAKQLKAGASYFVWHPAGGVELFARVIREQIAEHRQVIVWVKDHFALSKQGYHWKHENCFYGYKGGGRRVWLSDRTLTTVWMSEDSDPDMENDLPRGLHPTAKPVGLVARSIRNHVLEGGLVFEPFGGSGSTLSAAEQTGRLSASLELEPAYCAVILERMQRLGLSPRCVNPNVSVSALAA